MSVSCYFGLTESGKSYHVQNHVIPQWKKAVIFDNAHCFDGGLILTAPGDLAILNAWKKFSKADTYRIIIRPGRTGSVEALFNKTVQLAIALGRVLGKVDPSQRVQMITDEADFVCSPHYQSLDLKHLVNKGRHDNVDSHFIARAPMRIHNDIRMNSSKIVTFRLQNAADIPLFTDNFGREISRKIRELPKYWRLEWKDNGETSVFNEKNQKDEKFLGISRDFSSKKGGLYGAKN
jgi:hypothetical protein